MKKLLTVTLIMILAFSISVFAVGEIIKDRQVTNEKFTLLEKAGMTEYDLWHEETSNGTWTKICCKKTEEVDCEKVDENGTRYIGTCNSDIINHCRKVRDQTLNLTQLQQKKEDFAEACENSVIEKYARIEDQTEITKFLEVVKITGGKVDPKVDPIKELIDLELGG